MLRCSAATASVIRAALVLYQKAIAPGLGSHCRYQPTCSQYALEALNMLPLLEAMKRTVLRLLRCNLFFPGGYDPVTPTENECCLMAADGASEGDASLSSGVSDG